MREGGERRREERGEGKTDEKGGERTLPKREERRKISTPSLLFSSKK